MGDKTKYLIDKLFNSPKYICLGLIKAKYAGGIYVDDCHLLVKALWDLILIFLPQVFIFKMMIPLLRRIHEKLTHETLDNSYINNLVTISTWTNLECHKSTCYMSTFNVTLDNMYIKKYTGIQHILKSMYMWTFYLTL